MSWALAGRRIDSVLVTRLRYLGDIVMSTVLVEALRRGAPQLTIGYLCEQQYAPVLAGHPGISELHVLRSGRRGVDARARSGSGGRLPGSRSTGGVILDLKRTGYDLAVDLLFNPRSAWLLKLSGIPLRVGGTRKWRGRLYTHQVQRGDFEDARFAHTAPGGLGEHLCRLAPLVHFESGLPFIPWLVENFRPGELVPKLGGFPLDPDLTQLTTAAGLNLKEPFLLLAPCATWESKQWPAARWRDFLASLVAGSDLPVGILVAPGKEQQWGHLAEMIPPGRGGVLPPLSLPQALAVIARARAMVTVDGGLMHAAVGLRVPTVALFGPTDPTIWFPYAGSGPFRVLARAPHCHPCNLHECGDFICLPELEPEAVLHCLDNLLAETAAAGRKGS